MNENKGDSSNFSMEDMKTVVKGLFLHSSTLTGQVLQGEEGF